MQDVGMPRHLMRSAFVVLPYLSVESHMSMYVFCLGNNFNTLYFGIFTGTSHFEADVEIT